MESTASKTEAMKPLFIKAGISLVLSVAGFVSARIIVRSKIARPSSLETIEEIRDEASDRSLRSIPSSSMEDDDEEGRIGSSRIWSSEETSGIQVEEEILGLRNKIEELQKREQGLATQFRCYRVMKEREFVLMELKNLFLLETARVEFLDREISTVEGQKQRFENLLVEYLKVYEQLEFAKTENGLLVRKVKKLSIRSKERSHLIEIEKQNVKIKTLEAEIARCSNELEVKIDVIKKLEDEVREFQAVCNHLQEEENDLLTNLNAAETHPSLSISKIEEEDSRMEDYDHLVNELERINKDREAETTELIYLRWANACLRHELMRIQGQQQQLLQIEEDKKNYLELEPEGREETVDSGSERQQNEEPSSGVSSCGQAGSKRKKLLKKLKRWVEGGDNMKSSMDEKEKHEMNCFRKHSVSEEQEEDHLIHARRSCSSA